MTSVATALPGRRRPRPAGRRPDAPRAGTRPSQRTPPRPIITSDRSQLLRSAEASLIEQWRQADEQGDAANAARLVAFLADANRSLVARAARQYRTARLERQDLEQAATVGILTALRKFEPSFGVPFAAYASLWMRKEIQRALAAGEFAVAIPAHQSSKLAALRVAHRNNPSADDAHFALQLGVTREAVGGLRRVLGIESLDATAGEQPSPADPDSPVELAAETTLLRELLRTEINRLTPRQQRFVALRYGFDGRGERSCREVARLTGVSDFTVRTHLSQALATLRRRLAPHDVIGG